VTTVPTTLPPHTTQVQSNSVMSCLDGVGLVHARLERNGTWAGDHHGTSVFVDGPYATTGAAAASAQSLSGVEDAASGGRYVASATLTSHLGTQVKAVALCLGGSGTKSPPSSSGAKSSPSGHGKKGSFTF